MKRARSDGLSTDRAAASKSAAETAASNKAKAGETLAEFVVGAWKSGPLSFAFDVRLSCVAVVTHVERGVRGSRSDACVFRSVAIVQIHSGAVRNLVLLGTKVARSAPRPCARLRGWPLQLVQLG
jgi:hypothetical protein